MLREHGQFWGQREHLGQQGSPPRVRRTWHQLQAHGLLRQSSWGCTPQLVASFGACIILLSNFRILSISHDQKIDTLLRREPYQHLFYEHMTGIYRRHITTVYNVEQSSRHCRQPFIFDSFFLTPAERNHYFLGDGRQKAYEDFYLYDLLLSLGQILPGMAISCIRYPCGMLFCLIFTS